MDEKLKALMQELGQAINESLSDSDGIAAAIGEIRRTGYDVFLVLEATIGFNKRDPYADDDDETILETRMEAKVEGGAGDKTGSTTPHKLKWTGGDKKFLKTARIAFDDQPLV